MLTAASRRVVEFTQHTYLALLATVYPSGGPQVFPVWYEYDGRVFVLTSEAGAAKVRNIHFNPKVALCITDTAHQVKSLTVRGRAEVVMDNRRAQDLHRSLALRYLGLDEGEAWADSMAEEEMALISIVPDRFLWIG